MPASIHIEPGMAVVDSTGRRVGDVVGATSTHILIASSSLSPPDFQAPVGTVMSGEDFTLYLSVKAEAITQE